MDFGFSVIVRGLLFVLVSSFFLAVSRRALKNPRCHGFYRFFVFEGILILFLLNAPFWFENPLSLRQAASLAMLCGSIYCVVQAVRLLREKGGRRRRDASPENLGFENTAHLVTDGIFGHIRHPMYASLLLLTWGLFLKRIALPSLAVAMVTTGLILIAARVEESENLAAFGHAYRAYMQRTRRFIPFIF